MFESTGYDLMSPVFLLFQGWMLLWATFEAADSAHGSEDCGLHFDVPHSSLVRFPQILQFFFVREGTESPVQSALTCRDPVEAEDQLLWRPPPSPPPPQAWHTCDGCTFVEVVGAHGVSYHCGETVELRGALQELTGDPLIQLGAPGDDFSQHHLLKSGEERIVHSFVRDHHRPRSQSYRRGQPRMSRLLL